MDTEKKARRDVDGVPLTLRLLPKEYAAFKKACDGRPMAGVLRGLAAEFVAKVGGVGWVTSTATSTAHRPRST